MVTNEPMFEHAPEAVMAGIAVELLVATTVNWAPKIALAGAPVNDAVGVA
jgi:hypothetical protein